MKAFEWIYPAHLYCIACGNLIDGSRPYGLCDRCVRELEWIRGRSCTRCGKALAADWPDSLCSDCRERSHSFHRGYACVVYEGWAREVVRAMKYRDRPWIARPLAEAMSDRLAAATDVETGEIPQPDLIVSVPMYPKKARKRGYNQSDLLGRMLARHMDLPYRGDLLQRRRQTEVMSGLGRDDRRVNLAGAFAVTAEAEALLQETDVLLVDDVYTTGSTADACADALLAAGAARVDVLVFAAGANKLVT